MNYKRVDIYPLFRDNFDFIGFRCLWIWQGSSRRITSMDIDISQFDDYIQGLPHGTEVKCHFASC